MHLAGARTLVDAQQVLADFLPRFNARFDVPAVRSGSAYRSSGELKVDGILCFKEPRRVAKDNTVHYHGRTLQLYLGLDRLSYARARVEVQERLDGRLLVSCRGKLLTPEDAPPLAASLRASATSPFVPAEAGLSEDEGSLYPRPKPPPGPLAGEPTWYENAGKKRVHRDLVRAGMERARQQGKRIGRARVSDRPGLAQQLAPVLARLGQRDISSSQGAKELGISYNKVKRLMIARESAPLTKSLDT